MDRAPPVRDNTGPASTVEREGRARGGTASGGKVRFGDSEALQLGFVHRGLEHKSRRIFFSCPDLRSVPIHPSPG